MNTKYIVIIKWKDGTFTESMTDFQGAINLFTVYINVSKSILISQL